MCQWSFLHSFSGSLAALAKCRMNGLLPLDNGTTKGTMRDNRGPLKLRAYESRCTYGGAMPSPPVLMEAIQA